VNVAFLYAVDAGESRVLPGVVLRQGAEQMLIDRATLRLANPF
jgi:hypothetical protein